MMAQSPGSGACQGVVTQQPWSSPGPLSSSARGPRAGVVTPAGLLTPRTVLPPPDHSDMRWQHASPRGTGINSRTGQVQIKCQRGSQQLTPREPKMPCDPSPRKQAPWGAHPVLVPAADAGSGPGGQQGTEGLSYPWGGQGFRSDSPEVEEPGGSTTHPGHTLGTETKSPKNWSLSLNVPRATRGSPGRSPADAPLRASEMQSS